MDCKSSKAAGVVPAPAALWFDQNLTAGKKEDMFASMDDKIEIVFEAAFGKPEVKIGKPQLQFAMTAVCESFPDFTFRKADSLQEIVKEADNVFSMVLQPDGTNTGTPFAPMPDLPKVEKTGKYVQMTLEKFTLTLNGACDKITKLSILKQKDGLSGPPGFYMAIGGKLPAPPPDAGVIPAPVLLWFDQNLTAGKKEDMLADMDDNIEFVFEAAFGKPEVKLGKPQLQFAMNALCESFPDFTFRKADSLQEIVKEADNVFSMVLQPDGTNTGTPFAPMPDLPKVEKTGKYVQMTLEKATLTLNGACDKIIKVSVLMQKDGLSGPPGFYMGIGGKLPAPPPGADRGA